MSEKVTLVRVRPGQSEEALCARLRRALETSADLAFVADGDRIAVKTHFGEEGARGYVRPLHLRMIGELLRTRGGRPFLTETSTLYKGRRGDAVAHIELAHEHGFGFEATRMPLIMADGLLGDDELEMEIPGRIYRQVNVAALFAKVNGLVLVTHFTGHMMTGFGAALKNLGMGCASRRGKLAQHSTAKPKVKKKKCTGCGTCRTWCPVQAIRLENGVAGIDSARCIGCGECLAVCRFDAVGYSWSATSEQLQRKMVEHAFAVYRAQKNRFLAVTFLTRITRDCDCMGKYEPVLADIGILFGCDPVALDAAALDLVETAAGKSLGQLTYDCPARIQLEHAREIGFGSTDYQLVELPDGAD
jgi:uncharacterized protein